MKVRDHGRVIALPEGASLATPTPRDARSHPPGADQIDPDPPVVRLADGTTAAVHYDGTLRLAGARAGAIDDRQFGWLRDALR